MRLSHEAHRPPLVMATPVVSSVFLSSLSLLNHRLTPGSAADLWLVSVAIVFVKLPLNWIRWMKGSHCILLSLSTAHDELAQERLIGSVAWIDEVNCCCWEPQDIRALCSCFKCMLCILWSWQELEMTPRSWTESQDHVFASPFSTELVARFK